MSPEQARGKRIDRRTDIWAFGCVLYEVPHRAAPLSPARPSSDTAGRSILHKASPTGTAVARRDTPTRVRELLQPLPLAKDASQTRLRDIGDARVELEEILADPTATMGVTPTAEAPPIRNGRLALLLLLAVAASAAATWWGQQALQPASVVQRFRIVAPHLDYGSGVPFALSPDGSRVFYVADKHLWIRSLDALEPREVMGSEGASHACWSPDGRSLAFAAGGRLWRVPADGGPRAGVAALPERFHWVGATTWLDDGTIVWSTGRDGDPLLAVSAAGGDPKPLLEPSAERGEMDFHSPSALPGNAGVLFAVHRVDAANADTLAVLPTGSEEPRRLLTLEGDDSLHRLTWSSSGHILYSRDGSNPGIWALPYSLEDHVATGDAFLVVPDGHNPSASSDGSLIHGEAWQGGDFQLLWLDRRGRIESEIGEPMAALGWGLKMSPDASQAALSTRADDVGSLWVYDTGSGARTRVLQRSDGYASVSGWMPAGDQIVVATGDSSESEHLLIATDGSGARSSLDSFGGWAAAVTPDGKSALVSQSGSSMDGFSIVPVSADEKLDGVESEEEPVFLRGPGEKYAISFSPDGGFVAYSSTESDRSEIYLTRFPSGQGKWLAYEGEGSWPVWSPAGDEIFFLSEGRLLVVPVQTEGRLSIGSPEVLFDASDQGIDLSMGYGLSSDGQRILAIRPSEVDGGFSSMVLVQNWAAAFED